MSDAPSLRTPSQRIAWTATIVISTLVFIFLVAPILAIMPLSFSSGSYLTYPLPGFSFRWYHDFVNSSRWMNSLKNSVIIGVASTLLSMTLGTLAALGLAQWKSRFKPLVLAFVLSPVVGFVLERTLYRRLYKASHLDQVLFSIGLTFMSVAAATYVWGPSQQPVHLPQFLRGQVEVFGLDLGVYRLFLIGVVIVVTLAIGWLLERTRLGAQIRASVDNPRMAQGCGINVNRVFSLTFMAGSGLAGLGGAVGINLIGLDPGFPIKFMVYFLIVVAVGGLGSIKGSLIAALLLGVFDVGGKYYVPEVGAFIIYAVMVSLLLWRPAGLFGRR